MEKLITLQGLLACATLNPLGMVDGFNALCIVALGLANNQSTGQDVLRVTHGALNAVKAACQANGSWGAVYSALPTTVATKLQGGELLLP